MPAITSDELGIAFDMHGCPNRCQHCWLGSGDDRRMSEDDVRWGVVQFRKFFASSSNQTPIRRLSVASWLREPDYADNYRELYGLEAELSDGDPQRHELLSIWRLARDPSYAEWAKEVGPDTCQISFFGMEETNDWFHRRKGAFQDAVTATERLLEVGMKPRWQIFLTKKLLPELGDLLRLVERMRLRERVAALGDEFCMFMHTPGPDGNAREIEHLRPTIDEVGPLPAEIMGPTRKHFSKQERLWCSEAELVSQILEEEETFPFAYPYPEKSWLYIKSNWDVFPNIGTLEEWWCLGNLKEGSVAEIFDCFGSNAPLGLRTIHSHSPEQLVREYGDPKGAKIYTNADDLLSLLVAKHCEEAWQK